MCVDSMDEHQAIHRGGPALNLIAKQDDMKAGYIEFNEKILQEWKNKGIRFVKSEVLQDVGENEFGAESAVEVTPQPDAQPVNSDIIRDYAKADPSKVVYVVKEANV